MTLIKKIIGWIINLFKMLFGENNQSKKRKIKKGKKTNIKSNKQANINAAFDGTLPDYMIISDNEKEKLLYSIGIMKNILLESNESIKERIEKELINYIKKVEKVNESEITINKDYIKSIAKDLDDETKKVIVDKYQLLIDRDKEFKVHYNDVDRIINLINKDKISFVVEDEIDKEISNILNDKNIVDNLDEKIDNFNNMVTLILEDVDKNVLENTIREYKKVNYITLSTIIIDKNYERFKALENDFKNHRHNKYYYEREINRIKHELNRIRNLKNRKDIDTHINNLRKELYTKSKDKYDLLYNNEIFMNFEKECDNLLDKINVKVVDIKKEEKNEEKITEDKKKKRKYIEDILRRFQDMNLARQLILENIEYDDGLIEKTNIESFIKNAYEKFNEGITDSFNFERNRNKAEFIILYNRLNKTISEIKKVPFTSVDHINFRMSDLVEAVEVKNNEIVDIMKKKNIYFEENAINEKLSKFNVEKKDQKVLKKVGNVNER